MFYVSRNKQKTFSYGTVGEKIYHVWECDNQNYGFLVHSCFVNDGRSTRFDLVRYYFSSLVTDQNLSKILYKLWRYTSTS